MDRLCHPSTELCCGADFMTTEKYMYKLLSLGEYKNHRLVTLTTDWVVYEIRGIHLILLNKTTFIAQSRYQI